jgi:hypothetical protein
MTDEQTKELTLAEIEEIERAVSQMTPGEWCFAKQEHANVEEMAVAMADYVRRRDGTEMWVCAVPDPESDESDTSWLGCALTGNGPTAPANAYGITMLQNNASALLSMAKKQAMK